MFTNEFVSICKNFAGNRNDVLGEELEDSKKLCKYTVKFFAYSVEFRYVKKESVFFKASSLYCVLHLRKNSVVYYHLPDLIPYLEHKTFHSCYFWHIESPQKMTACFESLTAILENVIAQIQPFLLDDTALLDSLFGSYKQLYSLKDTDLDFSKIETSDDPAQAYFLSLQTMRDGYIFSRYCNFAPYALLLKNKVRKALAKYEKLKQTGKLFEYEKQLIQHITQLEDDQFHPFEPACDPSGAEKLTTPVSGLLGFLLVFSVFSVLFCSAFAIHNLIISINALVVLSAPWYCGLLCAGLCSIFGTIALTATKPLPNKHLTKEQRKNYVNILYSKGLKKFAVITFVLAVAASVFCAIMILTSNAKFYEDAIAFGNNSYRYDRIHSVYYIEARYNVYGDKIDRSSYVILFDDQTALDLDGYTSTEFAESEVLPLLRKKGFEVKTASSERELPWYTQE